MQRGSAVASALLGRFQSASFSKATRSVVKACSWRREEDHVQPAARPSSNMAPWLKFAVPMGLLPLASASVALADDGVTTGSLVTAAGFTLSTSFVTFLQTAGPACFLFLQLSGASPVRSIIKNKSTGQLSMLPFISLFTNCIIWTWYGYLIQDNTVMLPNVSGALFGAVYSAVYLKYATSSQMPLVLGSAALCACVSAGGVMLPAEQVAPYVGYLGDVLAVILMASPLAVMKTVLKDKSTKAMPFATSVATFLNGACWSSYGYFVMGDPLIWVPNVLGVVAATVQLSLFARFGIHKGD